MSKPPALLRGTRRTAPQRVALLQEAAETAPVEQMRKRLRELGAPQYGTKAQMHERLKECEKTQKVKDKIAEELDAVRVPPRWWWPQHHTAWRTTASTELVHQLQQCQTKKHFCP